MQPAIRAKYALIILSVLIGAALSPGPSFARTTPDQKAQQTLEHALQALGGLDRLRKLDSLYFKGAGSEFRSADLQGPDPSTPTKTFHEETIATFPSQEKILYEQRTGRHE